MDRSSERSLAAAMASGWIESEAPEAAQGLLLAEVEAWLAEEGSPPRLLWLALINRLEAARHRDATLAACRGALALMPDQPYFRLCLARCLHLVGDDEDALAELRPLAALAASDPEQLGLRLDIARALKADTAPLAAQAEAWAKGHPYWSPHHGALVDRLVAAGEQNMAVRLLQAVETAPKPSLEEAVGLGRARMLVGDHGGARALFTGLSASGQPELELIVGRFDGCIRPYSSEIEGHIQGKLDAARALPDAALARLEVPSVPPPPAGLRLVLAGFAAATFPNDMAHHLVGSARAAGLDARAHLDDALTLGHDLKLPDSAVAARVDAFEAALERDRPDIVLVDWSAPITARGLTPQRLEAMKRRLGFRAVVGMRDAHDGATPHILRWLEVADTVLLYHPLAPILESAPPHLRERLLVGWVPVHAPPPAAPPNRDRLLAFAGSVAFTLRNALLAVLLTEDLPFAALMGEERRKALPDMAAYLDFLRGSRAVLNISAHTHDEHLVTGRVWEAIACGAALVEQDNPATARYFQPWRHYLPWRTVDDIAQLACFVQRHPEETERIAAEAGEWDQRHYGGGRFWSMLVAHAGRNEGFTNPPR